MGEAEPTKTRSPRAHPLVTLGKCGGPLSEPQFPYLSTNKDNKVLNGPGLSWLDAHCHHPMELLYLSLSISPL